MSTDVKERYMVSLGGHPTRFPTHSCRHCCGMGRNSSVFNQNIKKVITNGIGLSWEYGSVDVELCTNSDSYQDPVGTPGVVVRATPAKFGA